MRTTRWVLGGALAAFVVSFGLVAAGATRQLDLAFTIWLQNWASPLIDQIADLDTVVGQASVNGVLMVALAIYLWRTAPRWAWVAPLFLILLVTWELGGKYVLSHPGPPEQFVRTSFNPLGVRVSLPSAFPSGHVARTIFFAFLLGGIWSAGWWRVLLAMVAIATPPLRIYLGDHWLSDTVGGAAIGVFCGTLAVEWLRWSRRSAASE